MQKTVVVVLSEIHHEKLISRSQAKRALNNLDAFNHITFDFKGVRIVGQGFVDEVYRVYQNKRPEVKLTYINANKDVEFMIKRSLSQRNGES